MFINDWIKMFWSLILTLLITSICNGQDEVKESPEAPARAFLDPQTRELKCLTDQMTDLQEWVDQHGYLTSVVDPHTTIDASSSVRNIPSLLTNKMSRVRSAVRFLSLAHCKLNRIPAVFFMKDKSNRSLAETLEYVTLYGNSFTDISTPGRQYDVKLTASNAVEDKMVYEKPVSSAWAVGLYKIKFTKLLELDLRNCSIETLNKNIFQKMPKLQALYLSDNKITTISPNAFIGLRTLVHLDLSRNFFKKNDAMIFQSVNVFRDLKRLRSLDLSYTRLTDVTVFKRLNRNFESISLCQTGITKLHDYTFINTSLKYIDVSGNNGILKNKVLKGTEQTLKIIIAENVGLDSLENFENFTKLEILNLNQNNIFDLHPHILKTFTNLKILDLTGNRLTTWFYPVIAQLESSLIYLSIKDNYINLITNEMMQDFSNMKYLALSGNFIVCNCNVRELYELALRNEINSTVEPLMSCKEDTRENKYTKSTYKAAYAYFNDKIINRNKMNMKCDDYNSLCEEFTQNVTFEGDYVLTDYDQMSYSCMLPLNGRAINFRDEETCHERKRWEDVDKLLDQGRYKLLSLITIPGLLLLISIFVYVFRKNFKYCFVTIRNSALLSLINKDNVIDDGTIFNYDVFVSYCNDDREWVLNQLLPHVEKDCNVSVCLHERDFQVGLSILENIVSCMDRSRFIMLIISKQFLLSQWCQFEMHLAQHRLLETRREDLILVLLEEIPRRARPTTLHYLMLTKTYIVWPKNQEEEAVFWRRLNKSLVTYRLKQTGNESLA